MRISLLLLVGCASGLPSAIAESHGHEDTASESQNATGTLTGKLTDWRSIPLAEATVILRNQATGATARSVTGKNGTYRFLGLGAGEYRLEADVPLLGKGAVEGILVTAGHSSRVQAALVMELPKIAGGFEANLDQLDPVADAVTTDIFADEMGQIPVSGRDWQAFAALASGARQASQGEGQSGGQIGSQAGNAAGDEANDAGLASDGALSFAGESVGQTAANIDGVESVLPFRVRGKGGSEQAGLGESAVLHLSERNTNTAAETAHSQGGGSVELTSNRGANGLHGQVVYRSRQSLWGAENPFTQQIAETAPDAGYQTAQFGTVPYTPAYNLQNFGLGLGSQLWRDRLFWFAALDGSFRNDPAVATVRHPESFFAQPTLPGLTALAARLGLSSVDPVDEAAAAYSKSLEDFAGLLGPVPRTDSELQGFGRLDWQLTERQHLSLEAAGNTLNAPGGVLSRSSETYASHSFGNGHAKGYVAILKWESFLTPNLLNSAAASFQAQIDGDSAQAPSAYEAPLLANSFNAYGELPEIVADSKYGFILGKPARLGGSKYPDEEGVLAQDTLSWVHSANLVKLGARFDHISDQVNSLVNQTGTYSYADALNFVTDVASFEQYGFKSVDNQFGPQSNCDGQGKVASLGIYPCYAWYSQRIGPANWHQSTNDLAAFATEQWQPLRSLTISAGVRVEAQELPPPIASVENSALPATQRLPATPLDWGPRVGLAWSPRHSTVLRAGAGLYYGRIDNAAILAALTQTGSVNGDLNFFFKPTDLGAPPFPYSFPSAPQTAVVPGAVSFATHFRPQEVDQAVFSVEQQFSSRWVVQVSALASLGRRLPISIDTNLSRSTNELTTPPTPRTIEYQVVDASAMGPLAPGSLVTVPLYDTRPNAAYQQLDSIESRANSTYQAATAKITREGGRGVSLRLHYTYAHATDWNPNESGQVATDNVLDPADFRLEYGTSNLDFRHSGGATVVYEPPWKLRGWAGGLADGWTVSAVAQYHSGLPFTMRTGGYTPGTYEAELSGGHTLMEGVATGINGSGGDDRLYSIGRNTYRYPATYIGNARLGKRFDFPHRRELELLAESFNLFNHQNVTLIETTGYTIERGATTGGLPTLNFLTGLTKAGLPGTTPEFGKAIDVNATNSYRPREIQLGIRARF